MAETIATSHRPGVDVDALLERIGLSSRPAPDLAGLRNLHRAYVGRVPYENLAIQLGEQGPLDIDAVARRVLDGGRGGYCFELNGVLSALLRGLGFAVTWHEAVVGERATAARGPTNHLALVVDLGDEGRWLADAGYGEGFLDPLALREGRHGARAFTWQLAREADGAWWVAQHQWGSTEGFRFAARPSAAAAFAPHHARLSTSPESPFVRTLVVQRPGDDRIVTLRSRTFFVDGPDARARTVLRDRDAFAATLLEHFGIEPAALGDARLQRLWALACAQHEAYLAARACARRYPRRLTRTR